MIKKYWNKTAFGIFALIGFLFVFFQLTGRELASQGNILWTGAYSARLLFVCALVGVISGGLGSVLSVCLSDRFSVLDSESGKGVVQDRCYGKRVWLMWLISVVLIVLCWLPGYLAYYPGICAYDTTIQLGQVESGN